MGQEGYVAGVVAVVTGAFKTWLRSAEEEREEPPPCPWDSTAFAFGFGSGISGAVSGWTVSGYLGCSCRRRAVAAEVAPEVYTAAEPPPAASARQAVSHPGAKKRVGGRAAQAVDARTLVDTVAVYQPRCHRRQ